MTSSGRDANSSAGATGVSTAWNTDAEAQLALALECGEMGTWHVDLTTRRARLSARAAALFGLHGEVEDDATAIIGTYIHPDDRAAATEEWEHAMATRTMYAHEYRVVRLDGSTRWLSVRGSTKALPGHAPYFSGVLADVTDRKEVEHAMLADRHKLEAIFRESPAAMALWRGRDLVFELVNPVYQAIFGGRELVGERLAEVAPELVDQGFVDMLQRVFDTGEPHVGHETLARIARVPGGPLEDHYYDFSYIRVLDTHGRPYGVYDHAVDVTERVLARRAMEAAQKQLEETVQMLQQERDLRERMVAALSHDLRTPLATARLSAQLLAHKQGDPGAFERATKRIVDNMDRADGMIRDLLDVSRIRGGEAIPLDIEPCDLVHVARSAIEDLVTLQGDRFALIAPAELRGHWDCSALRRIVENLGSNAVKYGAHDRAVTIHLCERDSGVEITVHNMGTPIPAGDLPTLFDLFKRSTGSRSQLGWGIGLSLVQALVQAHGGTIGVTSVATEGTTFTIWLPADARTTG